MKYVLQFTGSLIITSFLFTALFADAAVLPAPTGSLAKAHKYVRVYPAPMGEPLSQRFTVQIEKSDSPVYVAHVRAIEAVRTPQTPEVETDGEASFTSFDFSGAVAITITSSQAVTAAKVLPTSYGIKPKISGNKVTFTISQPEQLTLEVNGDWNNSLHLFANPVESNAPSPNDPNVIYFGPGRHEIESLKVGSGQTLYLAGGAVVYGKPTPGHEHEPIVSVEGSNIKVRGRGILDGSMYPKRTAATNLLKVRGDNIDVEGVVLRDSSDWTVPVAGAKHVKISNIKIFGWRGNSDGIDVNNSQDVEISNSFIRTFDDLVVIKTKDPNGQETKDVLVKHMVLWNEIAHALSLGAEMRRPVENITFTDCDVIHSMDREWVLRIFHTDAAPVRNVVFQNIRIEQDRRFISLWINTASWGRDMDRGHIDDVTFRNIETVRPTSENPIQLMGFDTSHAINDVRFEKIIVDGKPLKLSDVKSNQFVSGVIVTP
jgi:hypothetical protein